MAWKGQTPQSAGSTQKSNNRTRYNSPDAIAWLNLSLVDANGKEHRLNGGSGLKLIAERHIDTQMLKALGIKAAVVNENGSVAYEMVEGVTEAKEMEFTIVGRVNLIQPGEDIEF